MLELGVTSSVLYHLCPKSKGRTETLIIGIKPKDSFDELFPYGGAMVEVDETNFNTAIEELLKDRNYYNNLVERNYRYVMQNHRWKNRYDSLIEMIKAAYDDTDFCYTR